MWPAALKLDTQERRLEHGGPMSSIDDLHDHEFTQCSNEVDGYVRKNVRLQKKGK